jgi:hypothetical protein
MELLLSFQGFFYFFIKKYFFKLCFSGYFYTINTIIWPFWTIRSILFLITYFLFKIKLKKRKEIFIETRAGKEEISVWPAFCRAAVTSRGALLMAVVGGKLSEGINFSDELGRCVLMVNFLNYSFFIFRLAFHIQIDNQQNYKKEWG